MTPPIHPRGHAVNASAERRTFRLHEVRAAIGCAIAEGKALVVADRHVLVITAHPISRLAPNVEGDGFALEDELSGNSEQLDTQDACFDCPAPSSCAQRGCIGPHDTIHEDAGPSRPARSRKE